MEKKGQLVIEHLEAALLYFKKRAGKSEIG
jgi:hypothetical protein